MTEYNNPWIYCNEPVTDENIPEGSIAFVYEIRNTKNGKRYIGKKLLKFTKRKRSKKRIRAKIVKTNSDWKEYYGSNRELLDDRDKIGEEFFERKIIRFCKSRGEANYYESKFIFETDAILREDYYNGWVSVKVSGNHLSRKP